MAVRFQAGDASENIWPYEQEVKGRQVQHQHYSKQGPENDGTNPKAELGSSTSNSSASSCTGLASILPKVLAEALTSRRVNASASSQNNNSLARIQPIQSHAQLADASAICLLSEA